MSDLFGQDIKLDEDMQAIVAADGSLILTQGLETGLQDIRLRLFTRIESLFYDKAFGSLVHDWIKEENSLGNRLSFEAEVTRRINRDPRIVVGSAVCTVTSWDEIGIVAEASFEFIDQDHPYNLAITIGADKMSMILADVNPV